MEIHKHYYCVSFKDPEWSTKYSSDISKIFRYDLFSNILSFSNSFSNEKKNHLSKF